MRARAVVRSVDVRGAVLGLQVGGACVQDRAPWAHVVRVAVLRPHLGSAKDATMCNKDATVSAKDGTKS